MVDPERADDVHAVVEREVARDDVLRQLVGCDRREGDRRERDPLRWRPAPSERSANETGASPSVRRADADVEPRGARLGSLTALRLARVVDAERRPGIRLEPLRRRSPCRSRARSVRAVLDPLQRGVDLGEHLLRVLLERVVDLAVERRGRGVGEVVVARRRRSPRPRRRASPDGRRAGLRSPPAPARAPRAARRGSARCRCSCAPVLSASIGRGRRRESALDRAPARARSAQRSCPGRRGPKRAQARRAAPRAHRRGVGARRRSRVRARAPR